MSDVGNLTPNVEAQGRADCGASLGAPCWATLFAAVRCTSSLSNSLGGFPSASFIWSMKAFQSMSSSSRGCALRFRASGIFTTDSFIVNGCSRSRTRQAMSSENVGRTPLASIRMLRNTSVHWSIKGSFQNFAMKSNCPSVGECPLSREHD